MRGSPYIAGGAYTAGVRRLLGLLWLLAGPAWGAAPFLEIDSPAGKRSTVAEALVEIEGHGGTRRGSGHDVVIAIDVSESTLEDSGMELDGDGPAGRTDPELLEWVASREGGERLAKKLAEQDFDDTVLAAELEAARALVSRLDPTRFRVSILTFAEQARAMAPLGADRDELVLGLLNLPKDLHAEAAGTNYQAAIEMANGILKAPLGTTDDRLRSIVFLSDGAPTRPVHGDRAERYALEAAIDAGRSGIRLFAFAIGPEAEAGLSVLERMAGWTSGRLEKVSRPGLIVNRLRELDLVGLADVEVLNVTTGVGVRALRVFPDGSFDGFVELEPGANRLLFRAKDEEGRVHEVERQVTFNPAADGSTPAVSTGPDGPGSKGGSSGKGDPLMEKLKKRTAEIEAMRKPLTTKQRKELKIEAERRSR